MKRNCNLELRLSNSPPNLLNQQQQLTIFYNGRICVSDATEIQARAIIWMASKHLDQDEYNESKLKGNGSGSYDLVSPNSTLQFQLCSPSSSSSGMSMKKSLQRFLQKRKHRKAVNSPYYKEDVNSLI